MSIVTKIQWCDSTCNPTMGCEGCELWNPKTGERSCYAGMLHVRFGGVTKGYSPTFEELTFWPGRMAEATRWPFLTGTVRKEKPWLDGLPRLIFVSDMSDALSAVVPFDFLEDEVVRTVGSPDGQRHQWLWLTKRPDRMAQFCDTLKRIQFRDGHAGDWSEWPKEVRVRELPRRIVATLRQDSLPQFMDGNTTQPSKRVPLEVIDGDSKGRQAALKAWKTRKKNERKKKRSEAAKKAWKTRRDNEQTGVGWPPGATRQAAVKKMNLADPNPKYWSEYSNLQHVKHELIRHYLNGWFPKMTLGPSGCRRLMYIDTHAGRGTHTNGQLGSPLVALTTLLDHQSRDRMLQDTEVHYFFIERDEENVAALKHELAKRILPKNVFAEAESGDCFEIIESAVASFEKDGGKMAPSFVFVDPYGFKLPGKLLRKLLSYPKVELFVNVIWRELDMAIRQVRGDSIPKPVQTGNSLFNDEIDPEKSVAMVQRRADAKASLEATLNSVFDGDGWRKIDAEDADNRAEQCADLFREITGARWGTHIRMLDHGRVRYFLLHLTGHEAGRDLMKKCMWMACPHGGFSASKADNPRQVVLIEPEPNFKPLRDWVKEKLSAGPKRRQELSDDLLEELWLGKQLNEVIRTMRESGDIEADEVPGKFAHTNNPRLRVSNRPKMGELF